MSVTNLIFYNSAKPDSVLLMAEYFYKNHVAGNTLTVKDVAGINTATLTSYCSGLVAATYTEIVIACACESTAQSTPDATLNLVNQYVLLAKLIVASQGTLSDLYENATTYTATTIGLSTISTWTLNVLAGTPSAPIHIVLAAGTGSGQLSTVKSNTILGVATIYGTFYAVPDGTTDFKTLTGAKLFMVGQAQVQSGTVTKNRSELGWESMYPGITLPVINSYFAGVPGYALYTGTITSACGDATLTDSSLGASTDLWKGYYAVVYNASTFGYQYGKILSNTATVITLDANWGNTKPTGTGGVWRIYAREVDCLKDIYLQLWMMTNLTAVNSNSTHLANLTKLIDQNGALANATAFKQTSQDLGYLAECLAIGKDYLDYIRGTWTIMVPA